MRISAAVVVALFASAALPSAASALTDYTWVAPTGSFESWSTGSNWSGGTAPSGSVGTLTFPARACSPQCFPGVNDLTGLSAQAISIEDGNSIQGNTIELGAGGI